MSGLIVAVDELGSGHPWVAQKIFPALPAALAIDAVGLDRNICGSLLTHRPPQVFRGIAQVEPGHIVLSGLIVAVDELGSGHPWVVQKILPALPAAQAINALGFAGNIAGPLVALGPDFVMKARLKAQLDDRFAGLVIGTKFSFLGNFPAWAGVIAVFERIIVGNVGFLLKA